MLGDEFFLDTWAGAYTEELSLSDWEKQIQSELEKHVISLSSEIGIRNTSSIHELDAAARYIESRLRECALLVEGQEFMTSQGHRVRNIEARIRGTEKGGLIVVGAHYDSIDCAGANDNASGVAALIEIAAVCSRKGLKPRHSLRFVAFTNEEPPYFAGPEMGSYVYVRELKRREERLVGMVCLETMGYYATEKGSQEIPEHLKAFYHNDIGNFVAFTANPESRNFLKSVLYAFREKSEFPSEGLAAPLAFIPDITLSDNRSFWDAGFPAIMVTDTVYLRYKHYHMPTDTAEKLNYPAFAKVTAGLAGAIWEVAQNPAM